MVISPCTPWCDSPGPGQRRRFPARLVRTPFCGEYLVERLAGAEPAVRRDAVVAWVAERAPGRWTTTTRIQFASKLLSAAFAAGLVATNRDPRPVVLPRVPDDALTYLLYLLRDVVFTGTLTENPYLSSVGLAGASLEERLRGLPALDYRRMGDVADFCWRFDDLGAWAEAALPLAGRTP